MLVWYAVDNRACEMGDEHVALHGFVDQVVGYPVVFDAGFGTRGSGESGVVGVVVVDIDDGVDSAPMRSANRNSMWRALLPPNANPVASSRLMNNGGTASGSASIDSAIAARSLDISSNGVFLCASWMRGSWSMRSRMVWGCMVCDCSGGCEL